ncbi:unnamed protein product [Hydatigera taeniaeformis]|uniref:VWFC domain-containing protein n=1 Tax=Hydatigena taeniaeformis TaxID=6205 RepID=A0A0R3WZM4_HYDTA|nr:unnamed protein product [Hydatigera taeniaeformis]
MSGWGALLSVALLLTTGTSCAPIQGIDDRVEVHCINEYRQYCQGKPNGLNDGCRECKCENGAVLCKKGGCRFFARPGQDVLDYCETVYQKNAQKLAAKRRELSGAETQNNATAKVSLKSNKFDELTDHEKVEAAAKLQKLMETYISNQPEGSTLGRVEKTPYQMNFKDTIVEEENEQKGGVVALKPTSLKESPFNRSVAPELSEAASQSGSAYLDNSNGDMVSNYDTTRTHVQKESHSRQKIPRKRSNQYDIDKHFGYASEFRIKSSPEYDNDGAVGDTTVNRPSSWPLHYERGSGHKGSTIDRSPEIASHGRNGLRNRDFIKNKLKQRESRSRLLAHTAHHAPISLPKHPAKKHARIMGLPQNWPQQDQDFWSKRLDAFGERYDFQPIHYYRGSKHIVGNKHQNHQRQWFASLQQPHYPSHRKSRLEKDAIFDVGPFPYNHDDAMKSANIMEQNVRRAHPDYVRLENNEVDNKEYQEELLNEITTLAALGNMAVNLLISESISKNNSQALKVRNTSEFNYIVAMIEENIQAIKVEVEKLSRQTAAERRKLLRDIPKRLKHLIDWTEKASTMLSNADQGDDAKSEQVNEILIVMEDISSDISAAIESDMDSADESHHIEGEEHLYYDDNTAEANEAALLEWKFTQCMMLCSRCFKTA